MTTIGSQLLRYPTRNSAEMMTRRGWWLLVVNLLIPGSAQILAGSRRLGRLGLRATLVLWSIVFLAVILSLVFPTALYSLAALDGSLLLVQLILLAYAALWLILAFDTLRLIRLINVKPNRRAIMAAITVAVIVATTGLTGYATYVIGLSRGLLSNVFGDGITAAPVDGKYNILLLGGDAGDDRDGLRPDSISLVSIDASSGAAAIIGLPRDLQNIPFPDNSPMADLYPDGYQAGNCNVDQCELNSIYTEVQLKEAALYPDALSKGSLPGIEAMRDAVSGILGLSIQYYALLDMGGFSDLIDALGGVDINYTGSDDLPLGGALDENGDLYGVNGWLAPGPHHLDGSNALAYARSRYGTSGGDYDRMLRQREVQQAILKQFDPANVLVKFQGIAQAGSNVIKTDIPQAALGGFVPLALKAKAQPITTLELVPPHVIPKAPDYPAIRREVASLLGASE